MRGFDDQLLVVKMDFMQHPPYIIDFAKVRIDRPPDFSGETSREADEQGRELFGDNWPRVRSLLAALESYQIYYPQPYNSITPKPYNIVFPKDAEQAGPILP